MKTPQLKTYAGKTVCVMVVIPMVFLAAYPLIYLLLPDYFAIRADLIQDLIILLIVEGVTVPLAAAWFYSRARRRAATEGRFPVPESTRDVY